MKIIKSFKSKKSTDNMELYFGIDEEHIIYYKKAFVKIFSTHYWQPMNERYKLELVDCLEITKHFGFLEVFQ